MHLREGEPVRPQRHPERNSQPTLGAGAGNGFDDIATLQRLAGNRAVEALLAGRGASLKSESRPADLRVQRSPLSDQVEAVRGTKGQVFDLLRAKGPVVPADPDLVACLNRLYAAGTDDRWLAEQLVAFGAEPRWPFASLVERQRRAKDNGWAPEAGGISAQFDAGAGRIPVQTYYFPGTTDKRAMIIGGVHGSEKAGVEVVDLLLAQLRRPAAKMPKFSVIVVPALFPENVAAGRRSTGDVDPNRQMPKVGDSPGATDSQGRPVEAGNRILLDLIERFRPERIASCHGHSPPRPGGADMPSITDDPRPGHEKEDDALALEMAKRAAAGGARVPGNHLGTKKETSRYPTSSAPHQPGVSFGEYGSHAAGARPAMNVITIETYGNATSAESKDSKGRKVELESIATVLNDLFLNSP